MRRFHTLFAGLGVGIVLTVAGTVTSGAAAVTAGSAAKAVPDAFAPRQSLQPLQAKVAAQISPAQTNNVFVPITPCRIVDTRSAGGPMGDSTTRNFNVSGTLGFVFQGGKSGDCGIPKAATSIAANLTAITPGASGFVRAWPKNVATEPNATLLNYSANVNITGAVTLAIQPNAAPALTVRNHAGPTQLTIDVTGYYEPQMQGMVAPGGGIYSGSSRIISATNPSAGQYVVTFDSPITYCTPVVDTYNAGSNIYGAAYNFNGNTATVWTWYINSTTHLPTLNSYYFYIAIIC